MDERTPQPDDQAARAQRDRRDSTDERENPESVAENIRGETPTPPQSERSGGRAHPG